MRWILLFSILIISCTSVPQHDSGWAVVDGPITLADAEILEYEGKKLNSVDDFRENSIKGPQYIDRDNYTLEISGLVDNPLTFSYDEILSNQRYQKRVRLDCVEGWSATILWEGVLVEDLLGPAGIQEDATTIIFYASDGYSTSFPLSYIQDNDIILAYKMNGIEMPPERGFPFELVAESKWGYKWIKWVTKIELSDNEEYRGYWERRGYANGADLDKSYRDRPNQ